MIVAKSRCFQEMYNIFYFLKGIIYSLVDVCFLFLFIFPPSLIVFGEEIKLNLNGLMNKLVLVLKNFSKCAKSYLFCSSQ